MRKRKENCLARNAILVSAVFFVALPANGQSTAPDCNAASLARGEVMTSTLKNDLTIQELMEMVKFPTNPTELLHNIKVVAEKYLLVYDSFYSDEVMMHYFGGSKIEKVSWNINDKYASVLDLGDLFQNSRRFPGQGVDIFQMRVDAKGKQSARGKFRAGIIIPTGHDTRLTAEVVMNIFGTGEIDEHPYANALGVAFDRKTHKLGNAFIDYKIEHKSTIASLRFFTSADGSIRRINLLIEEIK